MSRRTEKISDLLQSQIAELLQRDIKHPALQDALISITRVEVAPDMGRARVHVSVMAAEERREEVLAALTRSEPFLHRALVKRLHMRRVPRLRFVADHSMAEGERITALIREVSVGSDGNDGSNVGEGGDGGESGEPERAE